MYKILYCYFQNNITKIFGFEIFKYKYTQNLWTIEREELQFLKLKNPVMNFCVGPCPITKL